MTSEAATHTAVRDAGLIDLAAERAKRRAQLDPDIIDVLMTFANVGEALADDERIWTRARLRQMGNDVRELAETTIELERTRR